MENEMLKYEEVKSMEIVQYNEKTLLLTGESGTVGQFLLTDTLQLAQGSDTLPHALCLLFFTHSSVAFE